MAQKKVNQLGHGILWFLLVILFPVLIFAVPFLMVAKLHKEKNNIWNNAKSTEIAGWVYVALGGIFLLFGLTGEWRYEDGSNAIGAAIMMFALFGGGGYAVVRDARKYKSFVLLYKRYHPVVSGSATGSLDKFSEVLGEPYEVTVRNIQKLIDTGLFLNSYIDQNHRRLISPIVSSMYKLKPVCIVNCPHCGGTNHIIKGQVAECDYCGSILRGDSTSYDF